MKSIFKKSFLQEINYADWEGKELTVSVLREDLVHPYISGNKWRKLKYNSIDFKSSGKKTLLTFGGAFSNHLIATAAFSSENGINCIGIVRGEEIKNNYLDFIQSNGMKLHFISRSEYRNKNTKEFLTDIINVLIKKKLINDPDEVFILPEGGSNASAVLGASEIMDEIPESIDIIACACGTGATLAGISKKMRLHQKALGISVLKANGYFEKEVARLGGNLENIILNYDYHFGGYAKRNKILLDFCDDFKLKTHIPIEPVYTGKLFFAINDLIKKDYFKKGTRVTLIHTGGVFIFN